MRGHRPSRNNTGEFPLGKRGKVCYTVSIPREGGCAMPFRAHLHTVNRHRRMVRHYPEAGAGVAGTDPRYEQIQPHGVLAGREVLPGLAQSQRPGAAGERDEFGGCTTRDATGITLSTGSTTAAGRTGRSTSAGARCRKNTSPRCSATVSPPAGCIRGTRTPTRRRMSITSGARICGGQTPAGSCIRRRRRCWTGGLLLKRAGRGGGFCGHNTAELETKEY